MTTVTKAGRKYTLVPMPALPVRERETTSAALSRSVHRALVHIKQRVLARIERHSTKFVKAAGDDLTAFLDALKDGDFEWSDEVRGELRGLLADVAASRSTAALDSVASYLDDDQFAAALEQANGASVAWAREHIGNMITDVNDTTRNAINEMTASAIESGWTNDQLARQLEDAWEFDAARALTIAETETAFAETAGTLAGWRESGVVDGKGWSGQDPCDICAANEDEGVIGIDDDFPSGDDGPPAHPHCACSLYAAVLDEE